MKDHKRIFGPTSIHEDDTPMGKNDSQFTTLNHIHTGQNKYMLTNSYKDAGFIKFWEHAFEVVRKSSMPVVDTVVYTTLLCSFIKTIIPPCWMSAVVDGEGMGKTYLMGSTWQLNCIHFINREKVVTLECFLAGWFMPINLLEWHIAINHWDLAELEWWFTHQLKWVRG